MSVQLQKYSKKHVQKLTNSLYNTCCLATGDKIQNAEESKLQHDIFKGLFAHYAAATVRAGGLHVHVGARHSRQSVITKIGGLYFCQQGVTRQLIKSVARARMAR